MSERQVVIVGATSIGRAAVIEAGKQLPGMRIVATVRNLRMLETRLALEQPHAVILATDLEHNEITGYVAAVAVQSSATIVLLLQSDGAAAKRVSGCEVLSVGDGAAEAITRVLKPYFPAPTPASSPAVTGDDPFAEADDSSDASTNSESGSGAYRDPATGSWRLHRPQGIRHPAAFPPMAAVLVIGISTGGPAALEQVLPSFGRGLRVPVLIVQHMPETFTDLLAERLDQRCEFPVCVGSDGMAIKPGTVTIAPGGKHMVINGSATQATIGLTDDPPENHCKPSVDPLFRSAVAIWGRRTVAAVLTGMGNDGTLGCQAVKNAGGLVLIQDEASSTVWGMPGSVAEAGLADGILPLDDLAALMRKELG